MWRKAATPHTNNAAKSAPEMDAPHGYLRKKERKKERSPRNGKTEKVKEQNSGNHAYGESLLSSSCAITQQLVYAADTQD